MLAALIFLATYFLKVPTGLGYANLGDAVILRAAAVLGPWAVAPAAIGSALADLVAGYAQYAPGTAVIKGLLALAAALVLVKVGKRLWLAAALLLAVECVVMAGGYFVYECLIYAPVTALAAVPMNIVQAVVGTAAGTALVWQLRRIGRR